MIKSQSTAAVQRALRPRIESFSARRDPHPSRFSRVNFSSCPLSGGSGSRRSA
jgi:hypothetical protein